MVEELHIEPVNDELVDLESLILDGDDAFIPLKFVYPNSESKTGVYLKPITGEAFKGIDANKVNAISLLDGCLFNLQKNPIPLKVIEKLPAGVIVELYKKLSEISGIEMEDDKLKNF